MRTLQEIELGSQRQEALTANGARASTVLSVVMPVFNEASTIALVISDVLQNKIVHDLVVVDDGSNDGTANLLQQFVGTVGVEIVRQPNNCGKGAALRLGFAQVCGQVVIIQDADLEYDPRQFAQLIEPILSGDADVVYGSRFLIGSNISIPWTTRWANWIITSFFNRIMGQNLTDVETCYKAFRVETLQLVAPSLVENRFGIEIELAARIARLPGVRVVERPIRYQARSRREGKKIRWTDGVRALWCILRFR